jgi:hypothetical protein
MEELHDNEVTDVREIYTTCPSKRGHVAARLSTKFKQNQSPAVENAIPVA